MIRLFFLFSACLLVIACDPGARTGNETRDTSTFGTGYRPASEERGGENESRANVEDFIKKAASSGMMEVTLGELASGKAASQQVREFGQMMVQDHSQANNKLKEIAGAMNVAIPQNMQEEHRQKIDDLQNTKAEEFDRKYMEEMIKAHEQDISDFEQIQDQVENEQLRSWALETLPTLRDHLQQAEQISQRLEDTAQR